jgi:hypothetical protein
MAGPTLRKSLLACGTAAASAPSPWPRASWHHDEQGKLLTNRKPAFHNAPPPYPWQDFFKSFFESYRGGKKGQNFEESCRGGVRQRTAPTRDVHELRMWHVVSIRFPDPTYPNKLDEKFESFGRIYVQAALMLCYNKRAVG